MRQDISDECFLEHVLSDFFPKNAHALIESKKFHEAALAVADQIFSKPFCHPIIESELDLKTEYILKYLPNEYKHIKETADYGLIPPKAKKPKGMTDEEFRIKISSSINTRKERASGAYLLARLFQLTNDKKYLKHSLEMAKAAINQTSILDDSEHPASFEWHAKNGIRPGHRISHVVIELIHALPFYRKHLTSEDKLFFLKTFLTFSDFHYKSIKSDVMFNLPLSLLTSVNLVACVFPQLKDSEKWIKWALKRTSTTYTTPINSTKDGFFREGIGYQKVVQNELFRNLLFWTTAKIKVPSPLYEQVKKSFCFSAQIARPDGTIGTITDTMTYPSHEPHLNNENILHLASAFFNMKYLKEMACLANQTAPCEEVIWDMSKKQLKTWHTWQTTPYKKKVISNYNLSASGFSILGTGVGADSLQSHLIYSQNTNHAHHDMGSVELWAHGRALITDPGFSGYGSFHRTRDLSPESHSQLVLSRYQPFGPRFEGWDHAKCTQFVESKHISFSTIQTDVYEKHQVFRTLAMINPTNKPLDSFWIILDYVKRKDQYLKNELELIDTFFHFNAPNTKLTFDHNKHACWSNHSGKDKQIPYYHSEDRSWETPKGHFSLHNFLKSLGKEDSDANLYIQALPQVDNDNLIFCLKEIDGFTHEFFGKVQRPSVNFCANGTFPFVMAYALIPFKGISKNAPASIEYSYGKNNLIITLNHRKTQSKLMINKIKSTKPHIRSI